jgi:methylglutaconyl-CoA hydratase
MTTSLETEQDGTVTVNVGNGIATVTFFHPKRNALPAAILRQLTEAIDSTATNPDVRVVVLQSKGTGAFCAGASFDELRQLRTLEQAKEFFSGFARVILAMRRGPKIVVARVQGKAVGGGVGLVAATDYSFALPSASIRLSELAVGLGPFVVGPVIERKVGRSAFAALSLDADWRDAEWAERHGLYTRLMDTEAAMDSVLPAFVNRLVGMSPDALKELKRVLWEGTNHWDTLLFERAAISGRLVLTPKAQQCLSDLAATAVSGSMPAARRGEP